MRRRVIAAAWITGATLPLLAAALFLAGCCVLPFHGVVHELMPLCETAANVIRGDHAGGHDHGQEAVPPSPGREKQEPVKVMTTEAPAVFRLAAMTSPRMTAPAAATALRSFISLGAVRCDRDVGLHVLVETFLI